MTWKDIELIFNRAVQFSFSRKKMLFLFPVLLLCGVITVFCRGLAEGAGYWMLLSLTFLPLFLTSSLLLAAGVVLTRIYHHEVKQLKVSYQKTIRKSRDLMMGISYLSVPFALMYLVLWTVLGLFYLIKEIPAIGSALGVILSFGPFLLMLGGILLAIVNIFVLFFVTPAVALKSDARLKIGEELLKHFHENAFSSLALFIFGLMPLLIVVGLLSLAAVLTGTIYLETERTLAIFFQWFFIMIPFSALLTPVVVFFFNFAAESYVLLQKKVKSAAS